MSYIELRKTCKTHFRERHLFKDTFSAIEFQTQLGHYFQDAMNSMGSQIVFGISFDKKEYYQYYCDHLAKPAKERIEALLQQNYFVDQAGHRCKLKLKFRIDIISSIS